VLTGGTDVHLVVVDLRDSELDGRQAEDRLHEIGITVNRNAVPFDPRPPMVSSGVRIGTSALASRGVQVDEFDELGRIIASALSPDFDAVKADLRGRMPAGAAISKVAAVEAFGAQVLQGGDSVDECVDRARAYADEHGWAFVHPFDDEDIVRGQAGLGLELLDDIPNLAQVIVPIGGGGLASGVGLAVKLARPDVRITGVQAAACAAFESSLRERRPVPVSAAATIADGIAIKRPGTLTLGLVDRWVDEVVTVDDDDIAEAMVLLLERGKLLAEGAGAAATAALLSGAVTPAPQGSTAVIVSGGNVDAKVLADLIARRETRVGRRVRLRTRVPDRPGGLAGLLETVADVGANVIELAHVRDDATLPLAQRGVELLVELRGDEHADALAKQLEAAGYVARTAG
jgi:threonine dehydratase